MRESYLGPVQESEFLFEAGFKRMEAWTIIEMCNKGYFKVISELRKEMIVITELDFILRRD